VYVTFLPAVLPASQVVTPPGTPTVTPTVRELLRLLRKEGECGSSDIRKAFGLKDRVYIHKGYLRPAMNAELIEMTIPDKPHSSNQKYRITRKGLDLLTGIRGESE